MQNDTSVSIKTLACQKKWHRNVFDIKKHRKA